MKAHPATVPADLKLDKAEVGYEPALPRGLRPARGRGRACETCFYSVLVARSDYGSCEVVSGVVERTAWCRLFTVTGIDNLSWESGQYLAAKLARLKAFLERLHQRRA